MAQQAIRDHEVESLRLQTAHGVDMQIAGLVASTASRVITGVGCIVHQALALDPTQAVAQAIVQAAAQAALHFGSAVDPANSPNTGSIGDSPAAHVQPQQTNVPNRQRQTAAADHTVAQRQQPQAGAAAAPQQQSQLQTPQLDAAQHAQATQAPASTAR